MTGYLILGLTLSLFVFGGLGFLIYHLKNRNAWEWPTGTRVRGSFNGYVVNLIFDQEAKQAFKHSVSDTAERCAKALDCLASVAGPLSKFVPKEYTVQVLGNTNYNNTIDIPLNV